MRIRSIRILVRLDFPDRTVRLWDGSGPLMDADGEVWIGATIMNGIEDIESALNAEASTLTLSLSGIDPALTDIAYDELEAGKVIGSRVQVLIQPCDQFDQPVGPPEVRFTGTVNNMPSEDTVSSDQFVSSIALEIVNRFNLRTLVSGSVLSDVDQRARSAVINPGANPDRYCERVPDLIDKTIRFPTHI